MLTFLRHSRQKVPYFNILRQKVTYFNVLWQKVRNFNVLQQREGNTEMKFFLSLILSRTPFPHSLSISSLSLHFLSISSYSLHFLLISSFSVHFLILSPFPLNFLIFSPFPRSPAARLQQVAQPWCAGIGELDEKAESANVFAFWMNNIIYYIQPQSISRKQNIPHSKWHSWQLPEGRLQNAFNHLISFSIQLLN